MRKRERKMEHSFLCNTASAVHSLQETITSRKGHSVTSISFPFPINPKLKPIVLLPILSSPSSFTMKCRNPLREEPPPISSAYSVLGVDPNCSSSELKAAFRAKVSPYFFLFLVKIPFCCFFFSYSISLCSASTF